MGFSSAYQPKLSERPFAFALSAVSISVS